MKNHLAFSRYSSVFEKNNVYAFYHSLRMKPVFLDANSYHLIKDAQVYEDIDSYLSNLQNEEDRRRILGILEPLEENKIITAPGDDDKIIQHFRESIEAPYIQIAYFILTENCNFNCSYCFVKKDNKNSSRESVMSKKTARKSLDFYSNLIKQVPVQFKDKKSIIFYGGEPLINASVLEYTLEKISDYRNDGSFPKDLDLSIVTNGSLLTSKIVSLLKRHDVTVAISVDGGEFCTNANRTFNKSEEPAYEHIKRGIALCREQDLPVNFSVTLSEESLANPSALLDSLLYEHNMSSLGFNILYTNPDQPVAKGYDERASRFIIDAFEVFRRKNIHEDRMLRKVEAFTKSEVYPFDCAATGGNQIIIAPDGQVGICHGFLNSRKYFITSIEDDQFNPRTSPAFQEWNKRTPLNMESCQKCPALGICGGGCPMNAYNNEGSLWALDERFCVHAKMVLEWLIWDLYEQATKKGQA